MSDNGWVVVRNWHRFQHRDAMRSAEHGVIPWIRTYTRLLHDDSYIDLTMTQRGALHILWSLYAASDGQLSVTRVSQRGPLSVSRKLVDSLNDAGFIDVCAGKPPRLSAGSEEKRVEEKELPLTPPSGETETASQPEAQAGTPRARGTNPRTNGDSPRQRGESPRQKGMSPKQLARFTGCKATRGSHGVGHKYDVLGTDERPPGWPHPKPTEAEIVEALNAAARALAG